MTTQEKKLHIDLTWSFIKSALLLLATLLGKDGLIEKIKGLLDGVDSEDGGVTTQGDPPACPKGQIWNPLSKKCENDY